MELHLEVSVLQRLLNRTALHHSAPAAHSAAATEVPAARSAAITAAPAARSAVATEVPAAHSVVSPRLDLVHRLKATAHLQAVLVDLPSLQTVTHPHPQTTALQCQSQQRNTVLLLKALAAPAHSRAPRHHLMVPHLSRRSHTAPPVDHRNRTALHLKVSVVHHPSAVASALLLLLKLTALQLPAHLSRTALQLPVHLSRMAHHHHRLIAFRHSAANHPKATVLHQ